MKRLPEALKDSYDLIFKQISNSQFPNPEMACRVMKWLLCAQRQLSTSEFIAAISVDLSGQYFSVERTDVLNICCNLVVHDSELDTFRFAHLSVREYLEGLLDYSSTAAHALALERCLIVSLDLLNPSTESQHLDSAISQYAPYFWHIHYNHIHTISGLVQLQNLQRILLDFFFYNHDKQPSFSRWVVMPGYRKHFHECEESISALKRLVTKDLSSVRLRDESAANTPQRIDSEVSVNVMFIDILYGEKADIDYLGPALPLAAGEGKVSVILMLLKIGADVNKRNYREEKVPTNLITWRDWKLLDEMPNFHDRIGERDHCDIFNLFLASGIGITPGVRSVPADISNDNYSTALIAAATYGQIATVQLLLEKGADVNSTSYLRNSPLHKAVANGNTAVSHLLLDRGADVNSTNCLERTALHVAVEAGFKDLVQLLLERGARISKKDSYGNLPIEVAAASGHVTPVKVLLQMEEDPNMRRENARKAFVKAFSESKFEVMRFLVDSAVSPTEFTKLDEVRKLAAESQSGIHNTTLTFLEANLPHIDALDNTGQTLLRRATKFGYTQLVSVLLEQKVDTEIRDFNEETVIQLAAREGKADIVRHLLDAKADINAATPIIGYTALHGAAESGHLNIVKMLVNAGADVNAELSDCQTAVHLAASKGHEPVVAFLLDFM
jgi:ankyrin repeat protein